MRKLVVEGNGHFFDYKTALKHQKKLQEKVHQGKEDILWLIRHPPVITAGKNFDLEKKSDKEIFEQTKGDLRVPRDELEYNGIKIIPTDRAGGLVYHYPGQIVGYPIKKSISGDSTTPKATPYISKLEEVMIKTLEHFGVTGERRGCKSEGRNPLYIGVWYKKENEWFKIGSTGVTFTSMPGGGHVTKHGFCLNIEKSDYDLINPCGIKKANYISLSEIIDKEVSIEEVMHSLEDNFREVFGYESREMIHATN